MLQLRPELLADHRRNCADLCRTRPADVGSTLAAVVTASNAFGSAAAQSSPSGTVAAEVTPFKITSTIVDGQHRRIVNLACDSR